MSDCIHLVGTSTLRPQGFELAFVGLWVGQYGHGVDDVERARVVLFE
jgi:hypothetical protein